MGIKNRLLDVRLKLGYKLQKDFAAYLEIDEKDYNRIENNKKQVSFERALLIARKLNMKVDEIFWLE